MWPGESDSHLKAWFFGALWAVLLMVLMVASSVVASALLSGEPTMGLFLLGVPLALWLLGPLVMVSIASRVHDSTKVVIPTVLVGYVASPFVWWIFTAVLVDYL